MEPKHSSRLQAETTRRAVLKKAVYVAPLVLTLLALPSFAATGSTAHKKKDKYEGGTRP
jgi:hypothetical protein